MKIATVLSPILFGMQAAIVSATVAKGNKVGDDAVNYHIAWIEGEGVCSDYAEIVPTNDHPCDKVFKLRNGYSYMFKGCGTDDFALYNSDGIFNHNCDFDSQHLECSVTKEWKC